MIMGRGSWVMWVMGQLCDGSHGSRVTKDDPFPSLGGVIGPRDNVLPGPAEALNGPAGRH